MQTQPYSTWRSQSEDTHDAQGANIRRLQPPPGRRFTRWMMFSLLVSCLLALVAGVVFVLPRQDTKAAYTLPYLERNEVITNQCSIRPEGCLWSNNKPRIERTSDGTVYVVYVSDGSSGAFNEKIWHLMKRNSNGSWQEIGNGAAGSEPSALLRGPDDALYVVAFPQNARLDVTHFVKSGGSYSSTTQTIPGFGTIPSDATYFGAGISSSGDIVIDQTSWNVPPDTGQFSTAIYWTYYNHLTKQWSYHASPAGFRSGYLFALAGANQDVQFIGDRDDQRSKIPGAPSGSWALINEVHAFQTASSTSQLADLPVAREFPRSNDFIIAQADDTYVDTRGRTHVLYMDIQNGGSRQALLQNGRIIQDSLVPNPNYWWMRVVQDTTGKFYLITMNGGYLTVYPAAPGDTDGTHFAPGVNIPLRIPYSDCQAPHLAVPRGGTPLSDTIDGFYESGSCETLVYFRLQLNGGAPGISTPTSPVQTASSVPTPVATPPPVPTPTRPAAPTDVVPPTPTRPVPPTDVVPPTPPTTLNPPASYTVYQSGFTAGWSQYAYQGQADIANTSPVLTGSRSLAWQSNAWGTLAVADPQTLDITPYGCLQFAVQAGAANEHYVVQLVDTNGKGLSTYLPLANYGGNPVPGRWKTYTIPLSDLKANGRQIEAIQMQNYSSNTHQVLYLDDIRFLAASSQPST